MDADTQKAEYEVTAERQIAALGALLKRKKVDAAITDGVLTVRGDRDAMGVQRIVAVVCKPLPSDFDRLWFLTTGGELIREADSVSLPDAALNIIGRVTVREKFNEIDALFSAVCRSAPQIRAIVVHGVGGARPCLQVSYRGSVPLTVDWDDRGERYRWSKPNTDVLPADAEQAAAAIAEKFGVTVIIPAG